MDLNQIQSVLNRSNETFAEALRAARGNRSPADLGPAIGASKSAWYRWEAGETLPEHRDDIERIADVLGCSLQERMRLYRAYFRDLVRFALRKAGMNEGEDSP